MMVKGVPLHPAIEYQRKSNTCIHEVKVEYYEGLWGMKGVCGKISRKGVL
jgi:hypothetical protein